jgi:hypothetical protein
MRTTLEIEDDVLEVAKDMARHQCLSLGKAVSLLIRKDSKGLKEKKCIVTGFAWLPVRRVHRP